MSVLKEKYLAAQYLDSSEFIGRNIGSSTSTYNTFIKLYFVHINEKLKFIQIFVFQSQIYEIQICCSCFVTNTSDNNININKHIEQFIVSFCILIAVFRIVCFLNRDATGTLFPC